MSYRPSTRRSSRSFKPHRYSARGGDRKDDDHNLNKHQRDTHHDQTSNRKMPYDYCEADYGRDPSRRYRNQSGHYRNQSGHYDKSYPSNHYQGQKRPDSYGQHHGSDKKYYSPGHTPSNGSFRPHGSRNYDQPEFSGRSDISNYSNVSSRSGYSDHHRSGRDCSSAESDREGKRLTSSSLSSLIEQSPVLSPEDQDRLRNRVQGGAQGGAQDAAEKTGAEAEEKKSQESEKKNVYYVSATINRQCHDDYDPEKYSGLGAIFFILIIIWIILFILALATGSKVFALLLAVILGLLIIILILLWIPILATAFRKADIVMAHCYNNFGGSSEERQVYGYEY